MPLNDAHDRAFDLATSLKAVIVISRAGGGSHSVVLANGFDGEASEVVEEIDPFQHFNHHQCGRRAPDHAEVGGLPDLGAAGPCRSWLIERSKFCPSQTPAAP
jgi:hypothetical protein